MRKFNGKCFSYTPRSDQLMCMISLGGEDGFNMSRNKISPRRHEPDPSMRDREQERTRSIRGQDEPTCRALYIGNNHHDLGFRSPHRRNNDKYDH